MLDRTAGKVACPVLFCEGPGIDLIHGRDILAPPKNQAANSSIPSLTRRVLAIAPHPTKRCRSSLQTLKLAAYRVYHSPMRPENRTRKERIDHQLARAGWAVGSRRLIEELNVQSALNIGERTGGEQDAYAFVDYALMDHLDRPLAIVEAKRSSRNPLEGERQASDYADAIRAEYGVDPFIFLANGDEIWFWHRSLYPPRKVSGFFPEDDLLRLAHLDRFGQPLTGAMPLPRIIDRAYQIEAVKTIAERIEAAERHFLLVLATGTGKTRVAVALVELLQRQERIQRVLFLADRRELVKQALGAFKEHLPGAPRAWIEGGTIDKDAQVHLATYPGMMSIYERLSPGYYDLIIADESHRSI